MTVELCPSIHVKEIYHRRYTVGYYFLLRVVGSEQNSWIVREDLGFHGLFHGDFTNVRMSVLWHNVTWCQKESPSVDERPHHVIVTSCLDECTDAQTNANYQYNCNVPLVIS